MEEEMQQKLQARLDVIRSELIEKGLQPGHIKVLENDLMPAIERQASLEFITDLIIDKNITVEELEAFDACRGKFFMNSKNIPDYIDIIRKYKITIDKVELIGKIGISLVAVVKTISDFELVMETISKNPITEAQCALLKEMHSIKTLEDFKAVVEIMSQHPLGEAQCKLFKHFIYHGKEGFKAFADVVSKHNLNKDQLDKVEKAVFGYLPLIIDMETLDKVMSNIEKYDQPTQPWKPWFWEKLGYVDEVKVVHNAILEPSGELVNHLEGLGDS